jgi:hypothetical protein
MIKERASERIELLGMDDGAKKALVDLSTTGVAFIHPVEAKRGTKMKVKIKEYVIDAVVIYCRQRADDYRLGMEFRNVPPDVQKGLKNLVDDFSRGVPLTCEVVGPAE